MCWVCLVGGGCKMAENVYQTLKSIIQEQTGMNSTQSDNFMLGLRVRSYKIYGDRGRKVRNDIFIFFKCDFTKRIQTICIPIEKCVTRFVSYSERHIIIIG